MNKKQKRNFFITVIIAIVLILALLDSEEVFNTKSYRKVPHGNQTHYVPNNYNSSVPIDSFPTSPPGPNQKITPNGKVVMKTK